MALTLCPNCRLPVNTSAESCYLCGTKLPVASTVRNVSVAATVAAVAALAMLVRKRA